ncbi:MAG: J domain-containing protein [Chloroflexi bacterium]|nr:J domain-containing protein [Chloroflexota bacterium]
MPPKNYYDILGVPRNASQKEIRQAFRKLARKLHPDVNPADKNAEARFKEVNRAYEVLSDPEKRRKYDTYGEQWEQAEAFERARQQTGPGGSRTFTFDLGEAFERQGGSSFDSILDSFFGRGRRRAGPTRGQNLEHPVEVTLEEAYHGTTRVLQAQSESPCPTCGGSGRIASAVCHVCQGQGVTVRPKRLEVRIPAGVRDGSRVRIAGEGRPGSGGARTGGRVAGPRGDLYLVVSVRPHERFERKGDDLHTEAPVSLEDAVLGGETQVATVEGKRIALTVPPLTQNGRVFRLTGLGMPHLEGAQTQTRAAGGRPAGGKGDLYVKVRVVLPEKLSERERQLFEQLRAERRKQKAGAKA